MENRINELEILLAHQDDTIRALNEEVVRQGREIDRLAKRLESLEKAMTRAAERDALAPEEEPPPPHY